ncbi:MAG: hypothetical protein M3Z36_13740 [Acidobacteriota bacterium]|nr:hypothetical protein [Acidobacteriota bacterium]
MAINDIKELRILPSLAIGRFGSSPDPMDNYDIVINDQDRMGFRKLVPAETLMVKKETGEITARSTPANLRFRDAAGNIRPVAPFLEVWARFEDGGQLLPLTTSHLADLQLSPADVKWHVVAANIKAFRRTRAAADKITADTGSFSDHSSKPLRGECPNFKPGKSIPLGSVQYIKPTGDNPEIRIRFTPASGKVFGPRSGDPNLKDDVYNGPKGHWDDYADRNVPDITVPGGIYAGTLNSQTGRYVSRGYLDDSCDGIVDVQLTVKGIVLEAFARVSAGPPDFAPDSDHPRTVADDLEQVALGPDVQQGVTLQEAADIVRRGLDTVRLMNTQVMNGNQGVGGLPPGSNTNNMAGHDNGSGRAFEPIFDPAMVDVALVRSFHEAAIRSLESGNPAGVTNIVRAPDKAGDLSDAGRRKMPAMMRGGDGLHLALTRRQINKIKAAEQGGGTVANSPNDDMLALIDHFRTRALLHQQIDAGAGKKLSDLFADSNALMNYLKTGTAKGPRSGDQNGKKLVVPGQPDNSAIVALIQRPDHPMHIPYQQTIPGVNRTGIDILRRWITSLTP